MEGKTFDVEGPDVDRLPAAIVDAIDPDYRYGGDGFDVLVIDAYEFWRRNSNMQVTVVLDRENEHAYHVLVLVGGGATGLLQFTAGAEDKILGRVCGDVEDVVEDLDLDVLSIGNAMVNR